MRRPLRRPRSPSPPRRRCRRAPAWFRGTPAPASRRTRASPSSTISCCLAPDSRWYARELRAGNPHNRPGRAPLHRAGPGERDALIVHNGHSALDADQPRLRVLYALAAGGACHAALLEGVVAADEVAALHEEVRLDREDREQFLWARFDAVAARGALRDVHHGKPGVAHPDRVERARPFAVSEAETSPRAPLSTARHGSRRRAGAEPPVLGLRERDV